MRRLHGWSALVNVVFSALSFAVCNGAEIKDVGKSRSLSGMVHTKPTHCLIPSTIQQTWPLH